MKPQVKYTHITERCSSIIKAFASLRIEQQTGDTVSAAYWRLREGKGLLTPFDKETLDFWCQFITDVRKYAASPYSIDDKLRLKLKEKREAILDKMEEYRDWLAFGSLPTYMYEDSTCPEVLSVTLEYCLSGMLYCLTGLGANAIPAEELKGWLMEIRIPELIMLSKDYADKFPANMVAYQLREIIRDYDQWPRGFAELETDKTWQIRTDMEHRSSVGAQINKRLAWINEVKTKTAEHRDQIIQSMGNMARFKLWKTKQRALIRHAKEEHRKVNFNEQEVYNIVNDLLDSIFIPPFTPIENPTED